jgi:hypothetical protein
MSDKYYITFYAMVVAIFGVLAVAFIGNIIVDVVVDDKLEKMNVCEQEDIFTYECLQHKSIYECDIKLIENKKIHGCASGFEED